MLGFLQHPLTTISDIWFAVYRCLQVYQNKYFASLVASALSGGNSYTEYVYQYYMVSVCDRLKICKLIIV